MNGISDGVCGVLVIGAGFGGAVAALRLAEKGYAERMLGTDGAPANAAGDILLHKAAEALGRAATFHPVRVGIHLGGPGQAAHDPYFGGLCPDRRGCTPRGRCATGCRESAKNSLRACDAVGGMR